MKIQLLTRVVHGRGFARKGDIIDVPPARGAVLVRRKMGIEVFPTKAPTEPAPETASSVPVEALDIQPPQDGSRTGRAITSLSLAPDQARPKRRYTRRKAKQKSSP